MKIYDINMICPKCKNKYTDYKISICPDCNTKLVIEDDIDAFQDNEYVGVGNTIEEDDMFTNYISLSNEVNKFLSYNEKGRVKLIPKLEKIHDDNYIDDETDYFYIKGYIYVLGYTNSGKEVLICKVLSDSTYNDNHPLKKKYLKDDLEYILIHRTLLAYKYLNKEDKKKVTIRSRINR